MSADDGEVVVSKDDVREIAALARLRLDARMISALTSELNGILEHVRVLESLERAGPDDGDGAAASGPLSLRDPAAQPDPLPDGSVASIAPDWKEGFFVVPRIAALNQDVDQESER